MISTSPGGTTTTFFFHGKTALVEGKSCRFYRCFDTGGQVQFSAHAFRSFRPTPVYFAGQQEQPDYLLKMRKSFPLTGKIDLLEARSGALRGVVTRGRKFYDGHERMVGRFDDLTSWREHFGESLVDFAGQVIFGGEGSAHSTTGSDRFVLTAEQRPVGSLFRKQLPFFPDPPRRTTPIAAGKFLKPFLPKKLGSALFDLTPPSGWKLEIQDQIAFPDLALVLCATMMTIEIRRW